MKLANVFVAAVVILVVLIVGSSVIYHSLPNWTERGQFGDMLGAVNTIFTAFALLGVIYTVLIQREQLALQSQELDMARKELERSLAAQTSADMVLAEQARLASKTARLQAANSLLVQIELMIEKRQNWPSQEEFDQTRALKGKLLQDIRTLYDDLST